MPETKSVCNFNDHAVLISAGKAECEKRKKTLETEGASKCRHGCYKPSGDVINTACSICRCRIVEFNFRPDADARADVLKMCPEAEDDCIAHVTESPSEKDGDEPEESDVETEEEVEDETDAETEESD